LFRIHLEDDIMMITRTGIACAAVYLGVGLAFAADAKIEAAAKTFRAVGADPAKLANYCALAKAMDALGEKANADADPKIANLVKQIGPDFEAAWNTGEGLDEQSADGKLLQAALDELDGKCPH
jgi:hypothetical protein